MPIGLMLFLVFIGFAALLIRSKCIGDGRGIPGHVELLRVCQLLTFHSRDFKYNVITAAFWGIVILHFWGLASPVWNSDVASDIAMSSHGIIAHLLRHVVPLAGWFAVWLYFCQRGQVDQEPGKSGR
ncbi:MAG: hypothetical protein D8M59_12775 [Planctomycetes bacterium]|nr:hypothetical protein [Planctomycetota bacterium]NOG53691.1 hypothetical protein [Planctomycetota bacterium]